MIQQTLEWHRFGEERPEEEVECLLISEGFEDFVLPLVVMREEMHRMEWQGPDYSTTFCVDSDLWAYWSEPKEEK